MRCVAFRILQLMLLCLGMQGKRVMVYEIEDNDFQVADQVCFLPLFGS